MNLIELNRSLVQLRLSGMAAMMESAIGEHGAHRSDLHAGL
jgi:hypothetical protein